MQTRIGWEMTLKGRELRESLSLDQKDRQRPRSKLYSKSFQDTLPGNELRTLGSVNGYDPRPETHSRPMRKLSDEDSERSTAVSMAVPIIYRGLCVRMVVDRAGDTLMYNHGLRSEKSWRIGIKSFADAIMNWQGYNDARSFPITKCTFRRFCQW